MAYKDDEKTIRVAFYIRVSTEEQSEKYGKDLQKDALMGLMQSRGHLSNGEPAMKLADKSYIYTDDISGTTPIHERPGFAKLMEDIMMAGQGNKPFDAIAVYKIDRFARKLKILLDITDFFEENGLGFISANESIDTSTPFGRAILGILGVISELEVENIKTRTEGGRQEAIKNGVTMGPAVPFGYEKDPTKRPRIFEKEAVIVRSIFNMFVNEKKTTHEIAKYLFENEIPSPQASARFNEKTTGGSIKKNPAHFWRPEKVRNILKNEYYTGDYYYNKSKDGKPRPRTEWKLSPYSTPQIIDRATFERTQRLLEQSKHLRTPSAEDGHVYLLSGLLKCDHCFIQNRDNSRSNWIGERKQLESGNVAHSYQCGRKRSGKSLIGCPTIPLPADEIEKYLINFTKGLLSSPIATYNHQQELKSSKLELKALGERREQLVKLINTIPSRKERLREQHAHSIIDFDQLKKEVGELEAKQKLLNTELQEIDRRISEDTLSQGYIDSLDLFSKKYAQALENIDANREEAKHILHTLIEEVLIYSRPVTDGDVIAGKKRPDQQIPYRIHVKLKLPQDILRDITGGGSGQKSLSGAAGGS